MQGVNIPFGSLVKATWLDSTALAGWIRLSSRPEFKVSRIDTSGYVVRAIRDEEQITLSTSIALNERQVIDPISIPWAAISELKVLEDPPDTID